MIFRGFYWKTRLQYFYFTPCGTISLENNMIDTFPQTSSYINALDVTHCDDLDIITKVLLEDPNAYERASQSLRRRFVRGAETVNGIDRGGRKTKIKRVGENGKYRYFIEGSDGSWSEPQERIWVVSMFALWQRNKRKA